MPFHYPPNPMTSRPRKRNIRAGWVLAVALGAWLGMLAPSCGMDNAPDAAFGYPEP
jgi:hypothetical protein